jgi:squalene-hopene/tetraprenyl-beta-curcumene cyclase
MADRRARCVSMLAQLGGTSALPRGIDTMIAGQQKDGSWFGRWA